MIELGALSFKLNQSLLHGVSIDHATQNAIHTLMALGKDVMACVAKGDIRSC
jgi:hypothetical protein